VICVARVVAQTLNTFLVVKMFNDISVQKAQQLY
jgi:hypothetical protein